MTTDFGKMLRRLRVDRDERLVDMGARLGVSASFLSAVERGKKPAPAALAARVADAYPEADAAALSLAAGMTRPDFAAGWQAAMALTAEGQRRARE